MFVPDNIYQTMKSSSSLSIVIDDFDSVPKSIEEKDITNTSTNLNRTTTDCITNNTQITTPKLYTRQSSDVAIRKILEEAEHRKHEFWKLIDEHTAVIENLKKIEQSEAPIQI